LLCDGNPHASDGEPPHARGLDLRWQTNGSVLTRRCTEVPTSRTNEPGSRRSTSPQPAAQFLSCSRSGHGRLACAWKFDFAASRGSGNPNRFTIERRSIEADPGRSFPGASDHPARFFENPRDVCPLDAVVNSAVDASGRALCPELSRPSTHAARADGVRSGSAASSSRRMIEGIVALNRNARCPPRATSTFLRCAPWCVSNRHVEGGQKGSCRE